MNNEQEAQRTAVSEQEAIEVLTDAMREADKIYEGTGGGTRHYVRDVLLPILEEKGYKLSAAGSQVSAEVKEEMFQPEDGYYVDRNGTKFKMTVLSDRIVYENINAPAASYFVYHPRVQKPVKAVNNKVDYNYSQPLPQEHDKETRQQLEDRLMDAIGIAEDYENDVENLKGMVNFWMKEAQEHEKAEELLEKRIAELEAPPDERNGIYVHDLQSRIKELEAELSKILEWMEQNEDTLTIEYEWHTIRKIREVLKR